MKNIILFLTIVIFVTINISSAPDIENKSVKGSLKAVGFYTDWQFAGIPGGIPKATVIYKTLKAGATAEEINNAIQEAGDAVMKSGGASPKNLRVVQLSEGIFDVGNTDIILNRSGVILRGMGNSTIVQGINGGDGVFVIGNQRPKWQVAVIVTKNARIGDSKITVENSSGFKTGQILKIDRYCDDVSAEQGGSEWHNGHFQFQRGGRSIEYGPSGNGSRPISQYIEIVKIQGNVLHLSNRINIDFPLKGSSGKALEPQVFNTTAHEYKYIGLENIKIEATGTTVGGNQWHVPVVQICLASSYSWVKNIESDGTKFRGDNGFKGRHIELNGFRNHVTGNYVHHSSQVSPGGNGYGIRWHGTDCIIDNNISDMLNKPLLGQTSNGGNVIAYNYAPNALITIRNGGTYVGAATPGNPQTIDSWNETAIDPSHGGYSHSDLFEGNYSANIHTDGTSNNGFFVLFRNHSFGKNAHSPTTNGSWNGVSIDGPQNEHASIGNVYLNPINAIGARVWNSPDYTGNKGMAVYNFTANTGNNSMGSYLSDGGRKWAFERFFWAHDYNYVKNDIEPSRQTGWTAPADLASSLYLASAPEYFNGYTWPPVNPYGKTDAERIGHLPAKVRHDSIIAKSNLDKGGSISIIPKKFRLFTDWKPGIPGGIPKVTTVFTTIKSADYGNGAQNAADAINKAIQAAGEIASVSNRQVVQLSEGLFYIGNISILLNKSNVVLRGMGEKTVIRGNNTGQGAIIIGPSMTQYTPLNSNLVDVIGNVSVNDTGVNVTDVSGFKEGDILRIDRLADDAGMNIASVEAVAAGGREFNNTGGSGNHNQFMRRPNGDSTDGPVSLNGLRLVSQMIEIERIDTRSNTLHLTNKININFPQKGGGGKDLNPQVWNTGASSYKYIGLENVKLQITARSMRNGQMNFAATASNPPAIKMQIKSSYCWVKNVWSDGTYFDETGRGFMGKHIEVDGFRNNVSGNAFIGSSQNGSGGNGYGIRPMGTDCLIDNNILDKLCRPILGQCTGGGNVIAYNYVRNTHSIRWNRDVDPATYFDASTRPPLANYTQPEDTYSYDSMNSSHGSYCHSDLFEGNYTPNFGTDAVWGNTGEMTFFRNHNWGDNEKPHPLGSAWTNLGAVKIADWMNLHISIGNVLLSPRTIATYSDRQIWGGAGNRINGNALVVYRFGNSEGGQYSFNNFYNHYDYNYITQGVIKDENNKVALPNSLFLTSAPDYFTDSGIKWPPVNPDGATDTERIGVLPAVKRYFDTLHDYYTVNLNGF